MRMAAPELGPVTVAFMRVALGTLFLLPLMAARNELSHLRRDWLSLSVAAFWNSAFPFCLLAYSASKLSAGLTAVLNSTTPVMAAVIGAIFLRQQLRFSQWAGLVLCLGGVSLLSRERMGNGKMEILPLLCSFGAATCYAIGAHYSRARLKGVPAIAASGGTLVIATIMILPLAVFQWPEKSISAKVWVAGVLLGVVCTGIAYILYFRLLSTIGATRASTVTVIVPVFAIFWGGLILQEKLTPLMMAGTVVVLAGSFLTLGMWKGRSNLERQT